MDRLRRLDAIRALVETNGGEMRFPGHLLLPELQKIEYRLSRTIDTEWLTLDESASVYDIEKGLPVKLHQVPAGSDKLGVIPAVKDHRRLRSIIDEALSIPAFSNAQKADYICDPESSLFSHKFDFKEALEEILGEVSRAEQVLQRLNLRGQTFIFKEHHPEVEHPGFGKQEVQVNGETILADHEMILTEILDAAAKKKGTYPDAFIIEAHGEFIGRNLSVTDPNDRQTVLTLTKPVENRLRASLEEYRRTGSRAFTEFAKTVVCAIQRPDKMVRTLSRSQGVDLLKQSIGKVKSPAATVPVHQPASDKRDNVSSFKRKLDMVKVLNVQTEISEWRAAIDVVVEGNPGLPKEQIYATWQKIQDKLQSSNESDVSVLYDAALGRINKLYGRMLNRHAMAKLKTISDLVDRQLQESGGNTVIASVKAMIEKEMDAVGDVSPLSSFKVAEEVLTNEAISGITLAAKAASISGPRKVPGEETAKPSTLSSPLRTG